jgi:hypothetical protein
MSQYSFSRSSAACGKLSDDLSVDAGRAGIHRSSNWRETFCEQAEQNGRSVEFGRDA